MSKGQKATRRGHLEIVDVDPSNVREVSTTGAGASPPGSAGAPGSASAGAEASGSAPAAGSAPLL
jgi:hypothetical protein